MFQSLNFPPHCTSITGKSAKKLLTKARCQIAMVLASVILVACGDDGFGAADELTTGVFLDSSAVEGLGYSTPTMSGNTNRAGEFTYNAGENVTFSLGGFELPTIQAAGTITPVNIFAASDVNDPRVADLSRLLQSLDVDGDASNGITLPPTIESLTSDTVLDFGSGNFDAQAQLVLSQVNETQTVLVDTNTATAGLTEGLVENEIVSGDCSSEHPFVGRTARLTNRAHGVSGTITVLNDCAIEVTNFNYDGGGPAVYFYAGVDLEFRTGAFPIGPKLNGRRWVDETVLLTIPEGRSLDDFNSLSVWCFDFNANFGDAMLTAQAL